MGFRFQRRLNLGGGWGLNASKSGLSMSQRTSFGSVGTRGFSIRSGIPGLSYRQNWGKSGGFAALIFALVLATIVAALFVVRVLLVVLPALWQVIAWVALSSYDLFAYVAGEIRRRLSSV